MDIRGCPMRLRAHQERALDAMMASTHGRIIIPTGGGKTLIAIKDVERRLLTAINPKTVVVVAPRILLANQLCEEFFSALNGTVNVAVMHVHSGETSFNSSTKVDAIKCHDAVCKTAGVHQLIFTTYNSLNRIVEAEIDVDYAYFDEAHNSVRRDFFPSVADVSGNAERAYFFTATPRYHRSPYANGMNNNHVYGEELISVPAPELIASGSILPPTISAHKVDFARQKSAAAADNDRQVLLDIVRDLDDEQAQKILVAAPNTKVLWRLLTRTDVCHHFSLMGYDVLHITAKHGAYVNHRKVGREEFFNTLTAWGLDPNRKFIIFHYSILAEGINCPGLTHTIMLRCLPVIEMAQTIGRVIRLDKDDAADIASGKIPAGQCEFYRKKTGFVTVPVFSNYGQRTEQRLQDVIDCIFVKGIAATETRYV